MKFQVGDVVRRKQEFRSDHWLHGNDLVTITDFRGMGSDMGINDQPPMWWPAFFDLVSRPSLQTVQSFDPHALAMALQLAKELQGTWANQHKYCGRWESVADWLRAEVQKELEAQP